MATDPEELLRSIERTREEVAHTVDTIAGRLDPKRAARQGAANVRGRIEQLTAKVKGGTPTDAVAKMTPYVQKVPKPAAVGAGLAALVAIAAVFARRRSR